MLFEFTQHATTIAMFRESAKARSYLFDSPGRMAEYLRVFYNECSETGLCFLNVNELVQNTPGIPEVIKKVWALME